MLDTNILVSALLVQTGFPAAIYRAWSEREFRLLTCAEQLDELRDTLRKPRIAARIKPHKAGRLVNDIRAFAEIVDTLPKVQRSPDPTDDFLLALCEGGKAEYLVTGDTSGLLTLGRHRTTRIVSARDFAALEAARRTQLAKGEVGIRDLARVPTLAEFSEERFRPFVRATFAAKPKTKVYYENGLNNLLAFEKLADQTIDEITSELIAAYVATRHAAKLEISSINRELQVLRRMFNLANEWKIVERPLHRVRMLKGENQRDRVLTADEEKKYLRQAAPLLRDVATVLIDCELRPEECFRLKRVHVQHGTLEIPWGKTENATRKLPMTPRVDAIISARQRNRDGSTWLFPAPTASGHRTIEH